MNGLPFHWLEDATITLTNNNSTSNAALKKTPTGKFQLRVFNSFTSLVFIRKGTDSTVAATSADLPIAPGSVEVLTINNNQDAPITHLAMLSPSGSGTLYATTGSGI